jgi:8-oxo-dGTP diphosphatase
MMTNQFCPKCAGRLKVRYVEAEKRKRQICQDCGFVFYKHSKPCVGVLVLRGDEVLLVQRAIEPFKGYWDIPGGFLEAGEHPKDGAVRELQEETGLVVEPVEILDIFMDVYGPEQDSTLNICYIARIVGGEPEVGSDAKDMRWFRLDELSNEIAFEWAREALDLLRRKLSQSMRHETPRTGNLNTLGI